MTSFAKAFVSHSSKDKPFVERVSKLVSAARWEIDSYSFEEGKTSAAEIFQSLSRSDLFVLIASAHSVTADWVKSELEIAQHLLYSRKLGGIVVFITDDTPASALPEWTRMYVFAKTANETRIANIIRSRLMQLDAIKGIQAKPFVQRMNIRSEIERRLADLTNQVNGLYISGVDGIGRRAIASNSLQSLFPSMDVVGIDIAIADGEGILETYRKLYFACHQLTVVDAKRVFDESSYATPDQLIGKIIDLINDIGRQKTFVWMQFDYGILDENGDFGPEFRELLSALDTRPPTLIIRAKRAPRFQQQSKLKNIAFIKVKSLSDEESRLLWVYALEYFKFSGADAKFVAFLQSHVSGHPAMIWTAAEYIASIGKPAIESNPRELLDTLLGLSLSLVDGLNLNLIEKNLLALFDEFEIVDPSDLIEICNESDQVISTAVTKLLSLGLLESEGDHLRLASFFHNARFRKQFSRETEGFLNKARQSILNITTSYIAEDNISFATIEVAVTTAIAQGKSMPMAFGDRAVVGSHYLRVARASYDREKYNETVKFASQALNKRESLTQNAIIETLRLLGMASVRINNKDGIAESLSNLATLSTQQAKRHICFIKGFEARWNGDNETAEKEFLESLKIHPDDTHALRELAQLLVIREEYVLAEGYARDALAKTPGNPFVIDILLQCLIERKKSRYLDLLDDEEVGKLFSQLEFADRREQTSFYSLRRAHFFSALNNPQEALMWADKAVNENPRQVHAYAVRAEIKLRIKNDPEMLRSVDSDIDHISRIAEDGKGVRAHGGLLAKLRIRSELAKGNFGKAIKQYEVTSFNLGALRKKLALEIANEAISKHITDPDIVAFANRTLSGK